MENPQKNKETAYVFVRYLKEKYNWNYKIVLPGVKNQPLFDVRLISADSGELLLQMKQVVQGDIEFMRSKKGQPGMGRPGKDKMFKNSELVPLVKKSEEQYRNEARNLILILHDDECYLTPCDTSLINKNEFANGSFKGIYMVSPEHKLFGADGNKIQNEFVFEIKNAFG